MKYLRNAIIDDEEKIYALLVELEKNSKIDKEQFLNCYIKNLSNPEIIYIVYEEHNNILGFISVHFQNLLHHTSNIAEIQELIVTESTRKLGIGKMLFEKAKDISLEHNCTQLEVCCNKKRQSSHEFYMSQGMTNNHYKFCLGLK